MFYAISDVPLIPQAKDMACWYASAQMLIRWRQERTQSCEMDHPDPSEDDILVERERANNGLAVNQVIDLAQRLGLEAVPPQTPTVEAVGGWLQRYGPVWFAGLFPSGHAVVITGILEDILMINDPWPPGKGTLTRMSLARFTQTLQPLGNATLASNFLHFPGQPDRRISILRK